MQDAPAPIMAIECVRCICTEVLMNLSLGIASADHLTMANNVPPLTAARSQISVVQIFVSRGHDYWAKGNSQNHLHGIDEINQVECLPGKGLKGDRYSQGRPNRIGQVTFIADEAIEEIRNAFDLPLLPSSVFRRNIVIRGVDLSQLLSTRFQIQGIEFEGTQECKPCIWMDRMIAPGAKMFMQEKFRGGLRAKILSGGCLSVDTVE